MVWLVVRVTVETIHTGSVPVSWIRRRPRALQASAMAWLAVVILLNASSVASCAVLSSSACWVTAIGLERLASARSRIRCRCAINGGSRLSSALSAPKVS